MGDFFDNTMGKFFKAGKARIKIKPELRAMIREKFDCTDEEVDEVLRDLAGEMTKQVHSDMDYLKDRGEKQQVSLLAALIKEHKDKANGRNPTV